MKYAFATAAAALVVTLGGGAAMAQTQTLASPDEAIKFRQATFKELQQNFKVIADMANGRASFDAAKADSSAARAAELIRQPWAGFGPGTEGGKAQPLVWQEQDQFKAGAARAEEEVGKLAAAAKTGNLDAIKTAVRAAGASCKACHDDFRKR